MFVSKLFLSLLFPHRLPKEREGETLPEWRVTEPVPSPSVATSAHCQGFDGQRVQGPVCCVKPASCRGRCSTPPAHSTKQQVIPESRVLPWVLHPISPGVEEDLPFPPLYSARIPVRAAETKRESAASPRGSGLPVVQKNNNNKAFLSLFAYVTCYK